MKKPWAAFARKSAKKRRKGLAGISKQEMLRLKIAESLVEADGFDLIAMGRPEGPGCYCYANNVLKSVIAEISGQYPYVVLDNEAGLENLSRRIVQKVDVLIMVSDPSNAGLEHAKSAACTCAGDGDQIRQAGHGRQPRARGTAAQGMNKIKADTQADEVIALPDDARSPRLPKQGRSLFEHDQKTNNDGLSIIDRFSSKTK